MDKPTQQFTGVFIPAHIWNDSSLTWLEKCLMGEIDALSSVKKGCWASNEYLAKMMGSSPSSIANMISKLRKRKLIMDVGFDGRNREIRTDYTAGGITPPLSEGSPVSEGSVTPTVKARVHSTVNQGKDKKDPKIEPTAPPVVKKVCAEEGLRFADWFKTLLPETTKLEAKWRENWAKVYDMMVRLDNRTEDEIVAVCTWARGNDFWASNFQSPLKLRDKKNGVMYFDVFMEKLKRPQSGDAASRKKAKSDGEYAEVSARKSWSPPEEE